MTTFHTPGEWKLYGDFAFWMAGADSSGRNWQRPVIDRYRKLIATAAGGTEEEVNANSLLIAAAPDLLAALKDCREHIQEQRSENNRGWGFKMSEIDAAIEKAGG